MKYLTRRVGTSTKKLEVTANEDNDNNAIINRSNHFEPSVVLRPCFEMKKCLPGVHKQSFSDQFQIQQLCSIMKLDGPGNWQIKWISIDTATNLINSLGALNKLNDFLQSQVDGDKIKPETLLNILSRPPLKCNITKV